MGKYQKHTKKVVFTRVGKYTYPQKKLQFSDGSVGRDGLARAATTEEPHHHVFLTRVPEKGFRELRFARGSLPDDGEELVRPKDVPNCS